MPIDQKAMRQAATERERLREANFHMATQQESDRVFLEAYEAAKGPTKEQPVELPHEQHGARIEQAAIEIVYAKYASTSRGMVRGVVETYLDALPPNCSTKRESGTLSSEKQQEAIAVIQAAIRNAPPERLVEEQQLRQNGDGPIEVLHERISFSRTPKTQAAAALAALLERFDIRRRG